MKQKSLSKFSLSRPVRWTELLEDKQYAKLGGVDTSQTYLLFQTLLILFWPHSCMIWTKLTRTDAVFSRAACMVLLCAGKRIFRYLRKIHEKSQKIHAPEGTRSQKWGQRGARGCPGALWVRPHPGPRRGSPGWGPHPLVPYFASYFYSQRGNPRSEVLFAVFCRGAAATLCSSSGGLIWRLNWPPEREDRRHRHHHHHSIIPPWLLLPCVSNSLL